MKFKKPQRLRTLAEFVKGEVIGDPDTLVKGLNDIGSARPGDAIFADTDRYLGLALSSQASVVIMPSHLYEDQIASNGKTLLLTMSAHAAINKIAATMFSHLELQIAPGVDVTARVDPSANVSAHCSIGTFCTVGKDVRIGDGTILGSYVVVEEGASIGSNCRIDSHVIIHRRTLIGDAVAIGSSSVIGSPAFYFYRDGSELINGHAFGSVELRSNVAIGAGCTIDRGISRNTLIETDAKLDNQVHIGHDVQIGKRVVIAAQTGIAGYSEIENDVVIRGQVGIMHRVRVGKSAVILGKSGVDQDVKENQNVFGIPAITRDRYAQRRRILRKRIRKLEKRAETALGKQRHLTQRVLKAIADVAGLDYSEVKRRQHLISDLGLDSLDRVELQMTLIDEFDVDSELVELRLDDQEFENINTVGDVVDLVEKSLQIKSQKTEAQA